MWSGWQRRTHATAVRLWVWQLMPTPRRSIRISAELWQAAQERAVARGEDVSDVLRRALVRYVRPTKGEK